MPGDITTFHEAFDGGEPLSGRVLQLVRRDQLEAVRRSVLHALPINALLGFAAWLVAIHAGKARLGLVWFAASTLVNLVRAWLSVRRCAALAPTAGPSDGAPLLERHLRLICAAALASGLVWAALPALCENYTGPQTLFYLTLTCGITAGAVAYGTAYAWVPISFITAPLLSVAVCLAWAGGFDRLCLAGTVLLYLGALIKGTLATDAVFRQASLMKNEARTVARSREAARAEASALAAEMGRRATHDDLTGLLNRTGFSQGVESQLAADGVAACLMLLDLDGFKGVNDLYGHAAGDRVLAEVARRFADALPSTGLLGRLGGDEFAIFLNGAKLAEDPRHLAERLIELMAEPFDAGRLGVSIGLYRPAERENLTHMLCCADTALHVAKAGGRNRFHVFDDALRHITQVRRDVNRDLAAALAEGAIEVWLQPIFGENGRVLSGFEALLRCRHPKHGWIAPNELVAFAAMEGLTEPLLRAILAEVCRAMVQLKAVGRSDLRVAMNVSPREMAQTPVDTLVLAALTACDLPAGMLEIEITEETATDIAAVRDKLLTLREAGVHIALDDFGVGYSSLACLHHLQARRIKMDRSLVTGLSADRSRRQLAEAVLGLGRSLDLEVVAEGVETRDDFECLQALGCGFMQGFLLGRPMPATEALALVVPRTASAA